MKIEPKVYQGEKVCYTLRSAVESDAKSLAKVRLEIDGETEYLDRVQGEGYIDEQGFKDLITRDTELDHHLFLVADVSGKVVGFSRCESSNLKRTIHKVEFGIGILKEYWGNGIGKNMIKESIRWVDSIDLKKMTLSVLETNNKAIELYKNLGFEIEGRLKKDKRLSDGKYYDTILMARFASQSIINEGNNKK
ncbi:GNAT family N-acetyltransferase [Halobacillus massiliensis]|uniref:GNAT family N-acetyltransferase n=1 Tax=Halobacillus massiliensis TaxID=1926286 RepID=UPI0009E3E41B|nr:GNAT family N-acetyltransferase [Halobacillus massiliensis]